MRRRRPPETSVHAVGAGDGPSGLATLAIRVPNRLRSKPVGAPGSSPRELADAPRAAAIDRQRWHVAALSEETATQLLFVVLVPRPEVKRVALKPSRPDRSPSRVGVLVHPAWTRRRESGQRNLEDGGKLGSSSGLQENLECFEDLAKFGVNHPASQGLSQIWRQPSGHPVSRGLSQIWHQSSGHSTSIPRHSASQELSQIWRQPSGHPTSQGLSQIWHQPSGHPVSTARPSGLTLT
ncbi:hypothetical protein LR48_Vigan03g232600 [Vigna angularis]|uniref:Uncharacterized protein n=1 Tax=Phaseolus angularis TaxID=3914 RepID=A0A0L9U8Y8_PHAAN|nr:hypothetical protein LR48_Vigan03g232600 [Vigna angularis]